MLDRYRNKLQKSKLQKVSRLPEFPPCIYIKTFISENIGKQYIYSMKIHFEIFFTNLFGHFLYILKYIIIMYIYIYIYIYSLLYGILLHLHKIAVVVSNEVKLLRYCT